MELSARMGGLMPYRKAADVLAEFLPIPSMESFMTLRHRTMKLGDRQDEKARDRAWFEPPSSSEHKQTELDLPNDPEREFVWSIDTAHVRRSRSEKARTFEIGSPAAAADGGAHRPAITLRQWTRRSANCNRGHFKRSNMKATSDEAK